MALPANGTWREEALCADMRGVDELALFFPIKGRHGSSEALAICSRCPVKKQCLDFALEKRFMVAGTGIWAGTTSKQRRELLKEEADGTTADA